MERQNIRKFAKSHLDGLDGHIPLNDCLQIDGEIIEDVMEYQVRFDRTSVEISEQIGNAVY